MNSKLIIMLLMMLDDDDDDGECSLAYYLQDKVYQTWSCHSLSEWINLLMEILHLKFHIIN